MVALLTGEALEVVDVVPSSHDHLEGGDHLGAGSAVPSVTEQPAERLVLNIKFVLTVTM